MKQFKFKKLLLCLGMALTLCLGASTLVSCKDDDPTTEPPVTTEPAEHQHGDEWSYTPNGDRTHTKVCGEDCPGEVEDCVYELETTIEATCTQAGVTTYTCALCGDSYTEEIAALGHDLDDGTVTKAPTCTETGIMTYACQREGCDYTENVELAPLGHELTFVEAVDPICWHEGNIAHYRCEICGALFADAEGTQSLTEEEVVLRVYHTMDVGVVIKAPTCGEAGTILYTCQICGASYTAEIPALAHTLDKINRVEATCEAEGNIEYYTCSACGSLFSDAAGENEIELADTVIPKAAHTLDKTERVEATCEAEGNIEYYTCSACGSLFSDAAGENEIELADTVIPKAGHDLTLVPEVAATCSGKGHTAYYNCNVCGKLFADEAGEQILTEEDTVIDALPHSFVGNVCSVCGAINMDAISIGSGSTVAVHDPSVVIAYADEYGVLHPEQEAGTTKVYFIFGTQLAAAYSFDMESWVSFTPTFYEEGTTTVSADYTKIFATAIQWPGYTDSQTIFGNLWAPDIVYNPVLEKWCLYYSMSGDASNFRSSVFMMTSDNITGPYVWDDFIVFSGFNNSRGGAGFEDYKKVTGDTSVDARYLSSNGTSWNNNYGVSCIDPAVLYDHEGNLWMFYGSWSGGIFLIKLDENTGLRDLTYDYGYADVAWEGTSLVYDPYLGYHVAGGYYVSGEGPYVEYIDGYYYLFMSYGFYSPEGGYNMRVFRSATINGKYTDPDGTWAVYASGGFNYGNNTDHGMILMQNYKWSWWTGVGYVAQGHNSVLTDDDGKVYLVYHVKYDNKTIQHNVEVHELVANADGWYLAAPFQKSASDALLTGSEDISGNWSVIVHNPVDYANLKVNTDQLLTLNGDGTLSGLYTGTWTRDAQYITIVTNEAGTFKGTLMLQQAEGVENGYTTYTFTAINENNLCIWGAKYFSDEIAAQIVLDRIELPSSIIAAPTLVTEGLWGAEISYESSNQAVLTNDGVFTAPATDTELTLTVKVTVGDSSVSKQKTVTIMGLSEKSAYENLPPEIEREYVQGKYEPSKGEFIPAVPAVNSSTGVSLTFKVTDLASDWDVIFRAPGGNAMVYLSVLNYGTDNIFEASATLSEEAKALLSSHGLATDGSQNWQIFFGSLTDDGSCYATISYNVDGSITFYRNGVLMLTYSADTSIGAAKVRNLVSYMIAQVRTQGLGVEYGISNVVVGFAADFDPDQYTPEGDPIYTVGTDNGDGTYTSAFNTWHFPQDVSGDFALTYEMNVKAPSLVYGNGDDSLNKLYLNWELKIGNSWVLRADYYSMDATNNFAGLTKVTYSSYIDWNDYCEYYRDADVTLTVRRTGSDITVTATVIPASGGSYVYTATYANFGTQDITVYLGGENCLINVYKVDKDVETCAHEFGAYDGDVAVCTKGCGATKVKCVVGNTTAEIVFEGRASAEIVENIDDNPEWWTPAGALPSSQRVVSGDFAIQYTWTNSQDSEWYQDVVLELTDGTKYFSKNFFISAPFVNADSIWSGTPITTVTGSDGISAIPSQPTAESVLGDYTASIVRIGDTLIVMQTAELDSGKTWKVVDRYENFPTSDMTVQITGNPYFADDIRVTLGKMSETTATNLTLGAEDNSTAYTGESPLWTNSIQKGQKVTVTGTATSNGANAWNSPLAYLWTGSNASLNFRADNWINGVDDSPNQFNGTAAVTSMDFSIQKVWKGLTPAQSDDWNADLKEQFNAGEFETTIVWDWTNENQIVISYQYSWDGGAVVFNQEYVVTALTGELLDSYSIGLGVDGACLKVTQITLQ